MSQTTESTTPTSARCVLLPFHDDSTLISATKFADIIKPFGYMPLFAHVAARRRQQISARQIRDTLNGAPDLVVSPGKIASEAFLREFDVVICAKYPPSMVRKWFERRWRFDGPRPCFVGTFPGIDFTPRLGIRARRFLDIICLNSAQDVASYRTLVPQSLQRTQTALQFSPLFYQSDAARRKQRGPVRHVVFFTQSIVPHTLAGRVEMLRLLLDAARANPTVRFTIKLRHLAHENREHTHQEAFAYQTIANHFARPLPINLRWSSAPMRDALAEADLCLTCSSSAGIESIAAGVPTLFCTDFPGADDDVYAYAMRHLLEGSNLLASRDDVLNISPRQADQMWLRQMLTDPSDVNTLVGAINTFLTTQRDQAVPAPSVIHAAARRVRDRARRAVKRFGLA